MSDQERALAMLNKAIAGMEATRGLEGADADRGWTDYGPFALCVLKATAAYLAAGPTNPVAIAAFIAAMTACESDWPK